MTEEARIAAEHAARASYGRLVAYLSAAARDVAAAEDALSEAFRTALETWPRDGAPEKPEAWLLTAARRRMIDAARKDATHANAADALRLAAEESAATMTEFPDNRLMLMFVCAHPAIDEAARTPLMLQTVLGLDAARIASAFLSTPAAMGARLSRAKRKIRDAGIAFETPSAEDLPGRLDAVLAAIYAAFGAGWDDAAGADAKRKDLAHEAIWLARLVVKLAPEEPEPKGLYALILYIEARRAARRDETGAYMPLSDQIPADWSAPLIKQAEEALLAAARLGKPGRYQLEAAIQSAHVNARMYEQPVGPEIVSLYNALISIAPSIGALVSRAVAIGEASGAAAGLAALSEIPEDRIKTYQPYWAARAHLAEGAGDLVAAKDAYARAIGLAEDPAVRDFLLNKSQNLHSR